MVFLGSVFFKEIDQIIKAKIVQLDRANYSCTDCGRMAKSFANLAKHVEDRHVNYGGVSCSSCGKHCTSRNSLATHHSRYHRK